jgi:cytochrome c553
MLHSTARALRYFGALGSCAALAVCTVYGARSEAQGGRGGQPQAAAVANPSKAVPIFGITIPPGYRDWKLISVAHEAGSLNDIRAILGNDAAVNAYREGKLPFPDGTIIARLSWNYVPSEENNKVFGRAQSFVAGSAPDWYLQFMVKDSKKYATTRGWGYAQFDKDGNPANAAKLATCAPCHEPTKASDYVFTHYAP